MAVPTSRTDLFTVAGSNAPSGTETVMPNLDNYLRAHAAFIRQNYDDIQTANTAISNAIPVGLIAMWSGASTAIPAGWALCDGSNGTPDLRNRFVIGATSTYAVGASGGATSFSLAEANLPSHTHPFSGTTASNGDHSHTISGWNHDSTGGARPNYFDPISGDTTRTLTTNTTGAHTHTVSGTTDATGTGTAVSFLPPYFALCYIQKL